MLTKVINRALWWQRRFTHRELSVLDHRNLDPALERHPFLWSQTSVHSKYNYRSCMDCNLETFEKTHWRVSPNGPTRTTNESHVTRIASLPHHSTWQTGPSAPATSFVSNSAMLRWKSVETTHKVPVKVKSASDFPFGDGDTCVKGPRERRWSTLSRLSTLYIVASTDRSTSTWRDMFKSGGMTAHEWGTSLRAGQFSRREIRG